VRVDFIIGKLDYTLSSRPTEGLLDKEGLNSITNLILTSLVPKMVVSVFKNLG